MAAELWNATEVCRWLRANGRQMLTNSWRTMVYRGHAPKPVTKHGDWPMWDSLQVEAWHHTTPIRKPRK